MNLLFPELRKQQETTSNFAPARRTDPHPSRQPWRHETAPNSRLRGPRRPWVYRALVARELGRPLQTHEIVHHINGDYTDNRLDNLMLLNSQKTHMTLHAYARMKAAGAETLFPLRHLLRSFGGDVLWATKTGYKSVFTASESAPRGATLEGSRTVLH